MSCNSELQPATHQVTLTVSPQNVHDHPLAAAFALGGGNLAWRSSMCVCVKVCSYHLAEGSVTMGGAHHKKVHNVQLYPHLFKFFWKGW